MRNRVLTISFLTLLYAGCSSSTGANLPTIDQGTGASDAEVDAEALQDSAHRLALEPAPKRTMDANHGGTVDGKPHQPDSQSVITDGKALDQQRGNPGDSSGNLGDSNKPGDSNGNQIDRQKNGEAGSNPDGVVTKNDGAPSDSLVPLGEASTADAEAMGGDGGTTHKIPAFHHVFIIMMENKDYSEVIGDTTDAPYINMLASQYAIATNYQDSLVHPSLPNYLYLTTGSTLGQTSDCDPSSSCPPMQPNG